MERKTRNSDYFRTQFEMYWPRVRQMFTTRIMPMIDRVQKDAAAFFEGRSTTTSATTKRSSTAPTATKRRSAPRRTAARRSPKATV